MSALALAKDHHHENINQQKNNCRRNRLRCLEWSGRLRGRKIAQRPAQVLPRARFIRPAARRVSIKQLLPVSPAHLLFAIHRRSQRQVRAHSRRRRRCNNIGRLVL